MFFQSFLRSSRLEILISRRSLASLYFVIGVLVVVWWVSAQLQFIDAYRTLRAFDVSIIDFFLITTFLMTPLFLVGCFLLRNMLQRLRLELWFKRQTNVPLYASEHSPAVAGYLVDYEFGPEEAQAMLLDLHFRGNLAIIEQSKGFMLSFYSIRGCSDYERIFLRRLFADGNNVHIAGPSDARLRSAAERSHDYLVQQLQSEGFLPRWDGQ